MLHTSKHYKEMLQDEKEKRAYLDNIFNDLSSKQLKEFLSIEMEYDDDLQARFTNYFGKDSNAPIRDYKSNVNSLYKKASGPYNMIEYGNEIDFDGFIDMANTKEREKDYTEAVRIYQELSEAIAENMDMVDDSDGYYGDCFVNAIHSMASCIERRIQSHEQKQQYISYMFEKYIRNDPDYFVEHYVSALKLICKNQKEYIYWRDLLEPHLPKKIPNSSNWEKYYNAVEAVLMKIYILRKLKDSSIDDIFAMHYRDDPEICIQYIKHLQKTDSKKALHIIQDGLEQHPKSTKIKEIACKIYKKTDPRYQDILLELYLATLESKYYSALKKTSLQWSNTLNTITRRLAEAKSYSALVDTYLKEGMYSHAIKQIVSCNDLFLLENYHKDLSARYPKEYFDSYKKLLAEFTKKGVGRNHYTRVKAHLKKFSTIPGHKIEFREFVDSLKRKYSAKPAFLDEIKNI